MAFYPTVSAQVAAPGTKFGEIADALDPEGAAGRATAAAYADQPTQEIYERIRALDKVISDEEIKAASLSRENRLRAIADARTKGISGDGMHDDVRAGARDGERSRRLCRQAIRQLRQQACR